MGIKENFTQAVKELTGLGKEKSNTVTAGNTVDELKKAVGDGSAPREIKLDSTDSAAQIPLNTPDWAIPDWDGSEVATVRPIKAEPEAVNPESAAAVTPAEVEGSTPAAEAFLSGQSAPVSLFGGNQNPQPEPTQQNQPPAQTVQNVQPLFPQQQLQQTQQSQQAQGFQTQQQAVPPFAQQQTQQPRQAPPPVYDRRTMPNMPTMPMPIPVPRNTGVQDDSELTIISRNTVIDGNVRSFADMSIDGDIKGDVETTKNIDLNGKIKGNVICNNAMMHMSHVEGNVRLKGNVVMKRDTILTGDLMSTYAEVNGKIQGNLDIVGKADLKKDAVVFGDISASTLTVEDGAIIQGYVSTTFLSKEESKNIFPDTIVIGDDSNETRL